MGLMNRTALIVGASGIAGSAAAELLVSEGWDVAGLARHPVAQAGVTPIKADIQNPAGLAAALAGVRPSLVVFATWIRRPTEAAMVEANGKAMRDLLDALRNVGSVCHVALVTGLKHYLGPFEAYGKGHVPPTPFREDQGRLDVANFYYARRTPCLPPPPAMTSAGAFTGHTPSSARRSATP